MFNSIKKIFVTVYSISLLFTVGLFTNAQYGSVPDSNNPDFGTALADFPGEATETKIENVSGNPGEVVSATSPVAGISKLDFTFKNPVSNASIDIKIASIKEISGELESGEPLSVITMELENATKDDLDVTTGFKITPERRSIYNDIEALIFNSPGVPVNIVSLGTDSDGNFLYETNSVAYSDFVVAGQGNNLSGGLLRTGGIQKQKGFVVFLGIMSILGGVFLLVDRFSKTSKN